MVRRYPGYTLIELLVVILIISVLMGLLVTVLVVARQRAAMNRAKGLVVSIQDAIELYQTDFRDYPHTDSADAVEGGEQLYQALRSRDKGGPYINGDLPTCDYDGDGRLELRDEWNNGIRYLHPRSYGRQNPNRYRHRLWSPGPDGRDEPLVPSSDDITNWDKDAAETDDGD